MVKLTIRIPPDVHEQLVSAAAADERSLNGEILWLLRKAIEAR